MRQKLLPSLLFLILALAFSGCGEGGSSGTSPGVGPFDRNGNYVEAWADNPPKKGSSRRSNAKPAKKPRANKSKLAKRTEKPKPKRKSRYQLAREKKLAEQQRKKEERIAKAEQARAEKRKQDLAYERRLESARERDRSRARQLERDRKERLARLKRAKRPKVTPKKPKPKSKPKVASKPKPKPKSKAVRVTPKIRRHVVKKGETLYSISRKYGVSISSIRKLNTIKGNSITSGRTLIIPR